VADPGLDLTVAKPKANPRVRLPLPLLREKTESVNQFAKRRKWRSDGTVSKKFWIITGVPTNTSLVAAFPAKAFNCTELLKSYLAGRTVP